MFVYLKLIRKTFLLKNLVFHKTGVNIKLFLTIRVLQTTLVNAYIYFSVDKSIKKPKLYKYNNTTLMLFWIEV